MQNSADNEEFDCCETHEQLPTRVVLGFTVVRITAVGGEGCIPCSQALLLQLLLKLLAGQTELLQVTCCHKPQLETVLKYRELTQGSVQGKLTQGQRTVTLDVTDFLW